MTFADQSDGRDSLSNIKGGFVLVNSRMSYFIVTGGILTFITTLFLLGSENFKFLSFMGVLSMIGVYFYLIYSSVLVLILGLLFKGSHFDEDLNSINDKQALLLILLMVILITVFPLLDKISSISSSFLILEILYGSSTIFLFISIFKNIVSSKE